MKRVMFDLDGVLVNFGLHFRRLLQRLHNLPDLPPEAQAWDDFIHGKGIGLCKSQIDEAWQYIADSGAWWQHAPPLATPDEFARINQLCRRIYDYEVYFVTARPGRAVKDQTESWLVINGIHRPTVVPCKFKGEFAATIGADYSLEDKAENAWMVAWATRGKTRSFLIDRPYNRYGDVGSSKVVRVQTVSQFLDVVGGSAEAPQLAA